MTFIEEYIPTYRALLATYPFIKTDSAQLKKIEQIEPSQRNNLLLDLNNGYDSLGFQVGDPNLFADEVLGQVKVIYGTGIETRDAVELKDEPDYFLGVPRRTVVPIEPLNPSLVRTVPDGIWYKDLVDEALNQLEASSPGELKRQGDDTVPVQSAIGTFIANPKNNVKLNRFTKRENPEDSNGNTSDTVDHTGIVSNKDVQKLILQTLGVNLDEKLISTNIQSNLPSWVLSGGSQTGAGLTNDLFDNAGIFSIDPVEGFLVDGQGRRLGYSQATGIVEEIPNSFWVGDTEGLGLIGGLVEGPIQLELTGLGEDYFISVALETEEGPVAIEEEGFLAQGEQRTFNLYTPTTPEVEQDFNNDGNADLVWRNSSNGQNVVWYMDNTTRIGNASFSSVPQR